MKKRNLFTAAYLMMGAAVFFTSCNNDEVMDNTGIGENPNDTQVLTLKIASSGDGMNARAGRPLLSSTADQKIQQVALYFVKEGKITLKKWVDWSSAVDYADGKQIEIALKKENNQKLPTGSYTVYAVGYSGTNADETDYTFTPEAMFSDENNTIKTTGETSWGNFEASLKETKKNAEEVFAGKMEVTVDDNGAFNLQADGTKNTIVLHRQVAGATGYFDNVPVSVNGKNSRYVRLVASAKNKTVKFENFNSAFTSGTTGAQYIVNGTIPATADAKFADGKTDAHTLYEIDLSTWFQKDPNYKEADYKGYDYNQDGFLGSADVEKYLKDNNITANITTDSYASIWVNPNKTKGQSVYRGTVFGAEFVIPINYTTNQNTLQLQVTDKDHNVLKYWNINIKHDQLHSGSSATYQGEKFDESTSVFNLYRNHMYSVGMKANNTTPEKPNPDPNKPTDPDPEKPTNPTNPDKENPTDLSKGQDLIIEINDNWEIIHDLEID